MRTTTFFTASALFALGLFAAIAVVACGGGKDGCDPTDPSCNGDPIEFSQQVVSLLCVKPVEYTSDLRDLLSNLTNSDCSSSEEEGFFETWHIYADQTGTITFDVESAFDSQVELVKVVGHTETSVSGIVVADNDDRSADNLAAIITATLEDHEDYLLRLSGFNDDETGEYTIRISRPSSPPPPPETGSVQVSVSSTGDAPSTYTVTLNGAKAKSVEANGTVTYTDIVTGQYAVELSDLNSCTVSGDNPQTVTITAGQTTPVSFNVSCVALFDHLAFASDRDGNPEIYVMGADGSNQRRLAQNAADDHFPSWSPDGSQIAFQSNRDGDREIYVMDADGSNPGNLTNNAGEDRTPAWSPDGTTIAFESDRDGDREIYVMDADGSNPTPLTNNAADDGSPAWSPDGTRIAFMSTRDGDWEIYVMDADGSNPTPLTNNAATDIEPTWSADGTRIAFASNRDGDFEVYVMDADGSNPTPLTNNAAVDRQPAWSPDGNWIAFSSTRDGNWEVYVMAADGSNPGNLTNSGADDNQPAWSPMR